MFFSTWQDFFQMGGYGFYVWLAYGLSLLCIVALVVQSLLEKRSIMKAISQQQQREKRLQQVQQRGQL